MRYPTIESFKVRMPIVSCPARARALLAVWIPVVLAGCLGDPTENNGDVPNVVYTSIHVGDFHACGVTNTGQAKCWGSNSTGQLGTIDFADRLQPAQVSQGTIVFSRLTLGGTHSCGLTPSNTTYCWGGNNVGQAGVGGQGFPVNTPSLVAVVNVFTTVRAGGAHTCGIVPSGFAWCWGFAQSGQLGNGQSGAFELQAQPDSVRTDLTFVAVATGGEHTCALTAAGEAYCWGLNTEGQLGNGTQANSTLPVAVSGGLTFAAIDAGGRHTCGITPGGQAYCWGLGESGQLGIGTTPTTVQVPTAVSGGLTFSAIDLGGSHTCALTPTKTAYCWGLNDAGQLGDGTEEMRSAPTAVAGDQTTFDTIEAGSGLFATVTCGMGTDGFAYCWGEGSGGQLGWGSLSSSSTPVQVKGQVGQ